MTLKEIKELLEKATPGPWVFCREANNYNIVDLHDNGRELVDVETEQLFAFGVPLTLCVVNNNGDECNAVNNAALIAAAPELAALLVRAVEETRATTAELDRLCSVISDEDIAIVEPVVDSARSFLHELGVEA